ncbi:tetraacyldisaccharide 4'-kinase [soil metagenome]
MISPGVRRWVNGYWQDDVPHPLLDRLLLPAEWTFGAAVAARDRAYRERWLRVERAPLPVVSVGNLAVGGAGKTPFASWLAGRLLALGRKPAVVVSGYADDEPRLHRELQPRIPVFAARLRIEAVRAAAAAGCDVAVLDDAFQHRRLHRNLDLVLIAAESWRPDLRLLPRGPWREPAAAAARADLVGVSYKSAAPDEVLRVKSELENATGRPSFGVAILPGPLLPLHPGAAELPLDALRRSATLAVAGIADPRPFLAHLRLAGADVEPVVFPDHHVFSSEEAAELVERARGRRMVMTGKDAVKLRDHVPSAADAWILSQRLEVAWGADALDEGVRRALAAAA